MEFEYSPRHHHSPSGAAHLLSPTHAHTSAPGFASIRQLRRTLSRSPSKPARFQLFTSKTGQQPPTTPAAPTAFATVISSPAIVEGVARSKSTVKRSVPVRTASRRNSPNSPLRRALSDNTNQAQFPSRPSRRTSSENDQENMDCDEDTVKRPDDARFNEPIKFDFSKPRVEVLFQPVFKEHAPPKSSPLKRSDGLMNLEAVTSGSPRAKRRSLHGALLGSDFNIFDQTFDTNPSSSNHANDSKEKDQDACFSSTMFSATGPTASPHRRPFSLRKSTLQQRTGSGRSRLFADLPNEVLSSPALTRARSRISLDSALPMRSFDVDSPLRRSSANDPPVMFQPPTQKLYQSAPKPHPLSHALTPSSSNSSMMDEHVPPHNTAAPEPSVNQYQAPRLPSTFSKSLPIGAIRPVVKSHEQGGKFGPPQDEFATPDSYKMAKPMPQAFMSTGLISKRNRNIDMPATFGAGAMPDTPSKKAHINIAPTPAPLGIFGRAAQAAQGFDDPSTPFHGRTADLSPDYFGKGANLFGSHAAQFPRRGSIVSISGDEQYVSPTQQPDSQSSADELPPTPTKSTASSTRPQSKGKSNSLRSSLFGRRISIGPDTFTPPNAETKAPHQETEFSDAVREPSPQTPQDAFTPPDASKLSISAEHRGSSLFPSNSFPPATPTGPREQPFNASLGQSYASSGYFANDVDTSMTSRFGQVTTYGIGEFSQVYRVEKALGRDGNQWSPGASHNVWAVKKSRKPYIGHKDRQRKMQEVRILKQLRGQEHIIELVDEWESENHLYIQTEFCENGNLKDFLSQTGFKGRLDDFRIWKILLELGQGIKSIHDANIVHLDIKPANVFIDWEGVLKIGDFGLASPWPAPAGLDGEGDREYIAPEVLCGRFDKPADIFSLGMVMLEIAGNIVLPDNGTSWQRLRAGDMSDLPSLTWSSDNSLMRDESGDPIDLLNGSSTYSLCTSQPEAEDDGDDLSFLRSSAPKAPRSHELVDPPNFMIDSRDPASLDGVVQWMIHPDPARRPVVDLLLAASGVQWVQRRSRAGASVYEGNWGPADDVIGSEQDVEMLDI